MSSKRFHLVLSEEADAALRLMAPGPRKRGELITQLLLAEYRRLTCDMDQIIIDAQQVAQRLKQAQAEEKIPDLYLMKT